MTNKLHGWVLHLTPGIMDEIKGYADVTWEIYETLPEGIESIVTHLPKGWQSELCAFGFADDMRDYAGLDGVIAFVQTNGPENMQYAPLRLGKHDVSAEFMMCGYIDGVPVPFHTEEQAHEVVAWFITKQATWYAQYSTKPDSEASEEGSASTADRSSGSAERSSRKTLH